MSNKILTVTLNPAIDYTVEVPNFTIDSVNRAKKGRRDPGGKGINVATALAQGGLDCSVTGFLGIENCNIFKEHFGNNNVSDLFTYVQGSTREGIKIADIKNSVTTDINFPGFNIKEEELNNFLDNFTKLVKEYDYVVLSGSIPLGVPKDIYSVLGEKAKLAGAYVALDSSGEALKLSIESGFIDLIKPNIYEISAIYPGEKNIDTLCLNLLQKVPNIALSLGEEGSRLYTKDITINASAPKIDVKSTVGAGDTFLAGFIGGVALGYDKVNILKNAGSWAASKLTMYGPGLSKENPPENYLTEIKIY